MDIMDSIYHKLEARVDEAGEYILPKIVRFYSQFYKMLKINAEGKIFRL